MPRDENTPAYYTGINDMTPIDLIEGLGLDFNEGSVIKYVSRWRKKDGIKDLRKALHYVQRLITLEEAALKDKERVVIAKTHAHTITLPKAALDTFGSGIEKKGEPLADGVDVLTDRPPNRQPIPTFFASATQFLSVVHGQYRLSPGYLADHGYQYREACGVEGTDSYLARGWYLKRGEHA